MSRYQAYPEYKDSGVEWLGEVPAHWLLTRIKEGAQVINGFPFDSKRFDPVNGVPLVRIRDINSQVAEIRFNGEVPEEALINNGDILIGMDGDFNVASWGGGEAALNQRVACVRAKDKILARFLYFILPFNMKVVNDLTYYTTVKHLSSFDILKTKYALPSDVELYSIVNFLDHETAKIDTLIEKQQQLIQLLKEKRQAVISHAVTKGLNPNAPMKDSGVEWLGEVPEGWELSKIKWFCKTESGGTPNTGKYEEYYLDGEISWIRTTDLNNDDLFDTPVKITQKAVSDSACSLLPVDSVLIAMYGGAGSIGKHALLKFESTINQAVCAILPNGKLISDFLHLYVEFYRPYWMAGAEGTRKDPNINQDVIRELIAPCPPEEEQQAIVAATKKSLLAIDSIIVKSEINIGLMQERRTALISAAVTGKIDVRAWQSPTAITNETNPQEACA